MGDTATVMIRGALNCFLFLGILYLGIDDEDDDEEDDEEDDDDADGEDNGVEIWRWFGAFLPLVRRFRPVSAKN